VIAYRYSTIIYWTWVSHLKKKSDFHLSNGVFPIFCIWNFSDSTGWKSLRGACNLRGTRDTKIQVIEVSVSSLYISSLCSGDWDQPKCPFQCAILWRQIFYWEKIGARILCLLFRWLTCTVARERTNIHANVFLVKSWNLIGLHN
jgi:hypothetical protein